MSDEPRIDLCACHGFRLWYHEQDRVCRCGHRDTEHLDGRGSCTGEIEVLPATAPAATAAGRHRFGRRRFRLGGAAVPLRRVQLPVRGPAAVPGPGVPLPRTAAERSRAG